MRLDTYKEVESLTSKLVSINSVNKNEEKIVDYLFDYLSKQNYFINHPTHLLKDHVENNRNNLVAYIKGNGNKTIILMGHIDTVDIKDYGKAEKYALSPNKLIEQLKNSFTLSDSVVKDIESNNYMFARGALDMKAGVSAYISVFNYFASHIEELNGNLLLLCECDEEGDSKGIIKALDTLNTIKKKEKFEYVACLNGDYSTSSDNNRYIYLGTVGKLLPCFVCIGKESHVGSPFTGYDPNFITSIINKNISLNTDLTDKDGKQTSVPPICLKQSDNKDLYTVQTASSSMSYFNYMIYNSSPNKVMDKCIKIAKDSVNEAYELMNLRFKDYCAHNNLKFSKIQSKAKVYSYKEWNELLSNNQSYKDEMLAYGKKLLKENPNIDIRDYSYKMIIKSYDFYELKQPVVVVCFGSMFYSSIETKDKKLTEAINNAIATVSKQSKYNVETKNYYPFISDMSFLSTPFDDKQIEDMINNCPFNIDYPYEKIKNLNIPVANIGTYGKDGHTYVERVEKDYSFNELPNLVYETIIEYFKS